MASRCADAAGAAEVVQYAEEQNRPVIRVWADRHEVLNRNLSNGLDASALKGVDRCNRQAITSEQGAVFVRNLDRNHFEKPEMAGDIPANTRELVNRYLFPYYARASILAKESQARFYRAGKSIYLFSAAAVGCAAIAVLFPTLALAGFSAELVLLTVTAPTRALVKAKDEMRSWVGQEGI